MHPSSPLSPLGLWNKLVMRNRRMAVAATARRLAVAIWQLFKSQYAALLRASDHLVTKLYLVATVVCKELDLATRSEFIDKQIGLSELST